MKAVKLLTNIETATNSQQETWMKKVKSSEKKTR